MKHQLIDKSSHQLLFLKAQNSICKSVSESKPFSVVNPWFEAMMSDLSSFQRFCCHDSSSRLFRESVSDWGLKLQGCLGKGPMGFALCLLVERESPYWVNLVLRLGSDNFPICLTCHLKRLDTLSTMREKFLRRDDSADGVDDIVVVEWLGEDRGRLGVRADLV